MENILILGAGRSSSSLINYLLEQAGDQNWNIVVADISKELALQKIKGYKQAEAIGFDIGNHEERSAHFGKSDLVISMLPPTLHILAAKECLLQNKNLITASYLSQEIKELEKEVIEKNLLFLNECGLDPGIDHMSAIQMIKKIQNDDGKIISFRSYTGGLVAPEFRNNPWAYKFTWNPRNVVLAGQSTARYLENGRLKYVPYRRLFRETRSFSIPGCMDHEGYVNRDSLSYKEIYGLKSAETLIRGTLRNNGFCNAWDLFVTLGLTDDSFIINDCDQLTYEQFVRSFLNKKYKEYSIKKAVAMQSGISEDSNSLNMVEWTGIFEERKIAIKSGTPAKILQQLLETKWKLEENDKDMVIMVHEVIYTKNSKTYRSNSYLVVRGDNSMETAMAKTVGLPMAIAAKLLLMGKISSKGVVIPVIEEFYQPILKELSDLGITFTEKTEEVTS